MNEEEKEAIVAVEEEEAEMCGYLDAGASEIDYSFMKYK